MPHFCIWEHPQYRIVRANLVERRPNPRKADPDGFVLRYTVQITEQAVEGALQAIDMLDDAMGDRTKGGGVYQASYADVRAAYESVLGAAPRPKGDHIAMRALCLVVGAALLGASCCLIVWSTIVWAVICMFRNRSGLMVMAESAIIWSIVDWRRPAMLLIRRAFR